jgi:hypothetical protein
MTMAPKANPKIKKLQNPTFPKYSGERKRKGNPNFSPVQLVTKSDKIIQMTNKIRLLLKCRKRSCMGKE